MSDEDIKKLGGEFERVLEPIYRWQDKADKRFDLIEKVLNEHTDKIDALTADVMGLQKKADVTNDRFVRLEEKMGNLEKNVDNLEKNIGQIRNYVGMPSFSHT